MMINENKIKLVTGVKGVFSPQYTYPQNVCVLQF